MANTRATLRLAIRELLREFYDLDAVGSGGISSSAVILPITSASRYKVGDLLQIESEQMKVEAIDTTNVQATVVRGYRGSTAAAHSVSVIISIIPEITDRMINYAINTGIADTYRNPDRGDMGIWFDVVDTTLSTSISTREYTIPTGMATNHFIIEVKDTNGNYQNRNDWFVSGTKIVFNSDFPSAGLTIRITGMGYQAQLADDTTNMTISDEQCEFVKYAAVLTLIEMRLGPRIKATEYSASVNDRAGQPNDMILIVGHFKNKVETIKARESKPMKSTFLSRRKR